MQVARVVLFGYFFYHVHRHYNQVNYCFLCRLLYSNFNEVSYLALMHSRLVHSLHCSIAKAFIWHCLKCWCCGGTFCIQTVLISQETITDCTDNLYICIHWIIFHMFNFYIYILEVNKKLCLKCVMMKRNVFTEKTKFANFQKQKSCVLFLSLVIFRCLKNWVVVWLYLIWCLKSVHCPLSSLYLFYAPLYSCLERGNKRKKQNSPCLTSTSLSQVVFGSR